MRSEVVENQSSHWVPSMFAGIEGLPPLDPKDWMRVLRAAAALTKFGDISDEAGLLYRHASRIEDDRMFSSRVKDFVSKELTLPTPEQLFQLQREFHPPAQLEMKDEYFAPARTGWSGVALCIAIFAAIVVFVTIVATWKGVAHG